MATAQERADAAYRAYRAAAERLAVAQRIGLNPQVAAAALAKAEADSHAANDALRATYPKAPPTDTGTGGGTQAKGPSQMDIWAMNQAAQAKTAEQNRVIGTLQATYKSYGLEALFDDIKRYARQDLDADAILLELKKTAAYKERFPAMEVLDSKGRGITEAEYVTFERNAVRLEREYGLPDGMMGRETVAGLLGNEVSAAELEERVVMAANASMQVPQEFRSQFQSFYGVDQGGLTAYFLDSDKAMPLLERQYAASTIAAEGMIQGVSATREVAEDLALAGVDQEAARRGFADVARDQALTQGKNNRLDQESLIRGTFNEADAAKRIRRARSAEVNQYGRAGGYIGTEKGLTGLGSANK